MRKHEYKKKYSPVLGKHVYKHVYGEGVYDVLSGLRRKLFTKAVGKAAKIQAKKAMVQAAKKAGEKVGTHVSNRAGAKIVKLLQGNQKKINKNINKELTDYEINEQLSRLLS